MARATTDTIMSLDNFAEVVGLNPFHFNQIVSDAFPERDKHNSVWYQSPMQTSKNATREQLARAIADAEMRIANYIGFFTGPKYVVGEIHRVHPQRLRMMTGGLFSPYMQETLQYSYFITGGQEALTLLTDNAAVVYSSEDGDSFEETATITVTYVGASAFQADEIVVYPQFYLVPGRARQQRIRNLSVSISGDVITITGSKAYFVFPAKWAEPRDDLGPPVIDGDDASNFMTAVAVYRAYTASSASYKEGELKFRSYAGPKDYLSTDLVLECDNPYSGVVSLVPSVWNTTTASWEYNTGCLGKYPEYATLNYLSGLPLRDGKIDYPMASAVAALAVSLIGVPICAGSSEQSKFDLWQGYPEYVPSKFYDCPFGMTWGAFAAWEIIRDSYMTFQFGTV